MVDCRNCQQGNITGAVFCVECGESLGDDDLISPIITDEHITQELKRKGPRPEPVPPSYSWISLHFMGSGKILPLASRNEFILGRICEESLILPDVDLTPYRAGAAGVSRLHAVVKREANKTLVMDLGSSNGTYINGRRIHPDVDVTLSDQDIIALGTLQIQVLLHHI
ncbi:MAG TPA: FHA domain-containing protein [Anaerolineales bacterium]